MLMKSIKIKVNIGSLTDSLVESIQSETATTLAITNMVVTQELSQVMS